MSLFLRRFGRGLWGLLKGQDHDLKIHINDKWMFQNLQGPIAGSSYGPPIIYNGTQFFQVNAKTILTS